VKNKIEINPETRAAVYARSKGHCENGCSWADLFTDIPKGSSLDFPREAVHLHHLTYERAGHELPEDLIHICIMCHMRAHPEKAIEIFAWETQRKYDLRRSRMTEEERAEEDERLEEQEEEALNLGNYTASGYCLEDVEEEEKFMKTRLGRITR
jgi:hypothetical protein